MMNSKSTRSSLETAMSRVLWAHFMAGAIGSGLLAVPAFAQPAAPAASSSGIEEVIVTARRVQESLQRVPVAVSAVSAVALEQKSITKVEELAHTVPGFTAQASYQPGAPVYTIRGQHGDTNPTPNTEPAVQVYFAEMNTARAIGTTSSFYDVESVQVLKGPQGTLFGRNSTGGAILITPRAPQDTFGGYVQGSYGNFDYRDFEAVLNIPVTDKAALRVAGKITKRDGYIENIVNGERANGLDQVAGRVSLLLKPTDSVKSTFIATTYTSKDEGAAFKLAKIEPTFFAATGAAALIPPLQAEIAALNALGPYKTQNKGFLYTHERVSSIQNNTEIELNDHLTLKNIVGYRRTHQDQQSDFVGGYIFGDLFRNGINATSELFTEELQLQGKGQHFDYVVGGYILHEQLPGLRAFNQIFNVFAGVIPGFPIKNVIKDDYTTNSYSGFAHGTYDLSSLIDGLSISGGARLSYDLKKVTFRNINADGTPPGQFGFQCLANGAILATADFDVCSMPERITSTELTYDVSLNYQMNPDTLAYVAHRHGYRAGGFDILLPLGSANPHFDPEKVDDIEVGVKSDFHLGGMPVRTNVAGYYQMYKNIQHLIAIPLGGSVVNSTVNIAKASIYGAELEMTLKPTPAMELSGSYAYTKPKTKEWKLPPLGGVPALDVSDSFFNYVAEHQWSVTGRYTLPIPEQMGALSLAVIWYGQSLMHAPDDTTANCGGGTSLLCLGRDVVVPGYDLVNLRADWKNVGGKGFDVGVFATNVTNKVYTASVLGLNGVLGTQANVVGAPRMYGVTLRVPFGGEAN